MLSCARFMKSPLLGILTFCAAIMSRTEAQSPRVVLSEIMYHPVEVPAFAADGTPLLDLSSDVHEFVELVNPGTNAISLNSWRLSGGIDFIFPAGASVQPRGFVVVAKNPA